MSAELEIMPEGALEEVRLVVQQTNIGIETANSLQSSFLPLFKEARNVLEKSRGITVTDASQKLEIKLARECRLELRRIRTTGDKLRKELKDESLRRGRAIDGFQNILLHITTEEEERLDAQEKFVERQEAQRKAERKASREAALAPFGIDTSFLSLTEMPDDTFAQLLENTRAGHEAKLEAARKAESDRIAAENARLKEEARIREENARLQREAQEREAAARKEREEAAAKLAAEQAAARAAKEEADRQAKAQQEAAGAALRAERVRLETIAADERRKAAKAAEEAAAKAKIERDAREKAERELAEQRQAEERRKKSEQDAARKAARAPDREKLVALASHIRNVDFPVMTSEEARQIATDASRQLEQIAKQLEQEATKL